MTELIKLDPTGRYPPTREVFLAVVDMFLDTEERHARTTWEREHLEWFRNELEDPKKFEMYYQIWLGFGRRKAS